MNLNIGLNKNPKFMAIAVLKYLSCVSRQQMRHPPHVEYNPRTQYLGFAVKLTKIRTEWVITAMETPRLRMREKRMTPRNCSASTADKF